METVTHHGRETAYRFVGDDGGGPTVLYVHGSGGTHRVWAPQYGPDGPSHPAVALDLSGHGESEDVDATAGSETLSAYAEDVVAVARASGASVLAGNSLGGAVAQWVVLETDWRPAGLVLTGTGPSLPVSKPLREWLRVDFERAVEFLHGRDRLFHTTDETLLGRSRDRMHAVGQRVTERDFTTCDRFDVADDLDDIAVPTLAVCGAHDELTPPASHERLATALPRGEFALVPDAAHLAMLERPAAFNDHVSAFLDARTRDYSNQ